MIIIKHITYWVELAPEIKPEVVFDLVSFTEFCDLDVSPPGRKFFDLLRQVEGLTSRLDLDPYIFWQRLISWRESNSMMLKSSPFNF